jgi:hypothetical protein
MGDVPLPKLPGCSFTDPRSPVKKKPQTLNYVNGYAVPGDPMQMGTNARTRPLLGGTSASEGEILDLGPALETLPAWVAYDRKVLRFGSYFKEAVTDSNSETYRIRKCLIYFYLEDDSLHVAEPKQQNSGIPQGVFLKRHRVPVADGDSYVTFEHLNVGVEVNFYARVFHVVSCDPFTRTFLTNSGIEVPADLPYPDDPIDDYRATIAKKNKAGGAPNPRYDDLTRFIEAKLGKATNALNPDKLKSFLAHDRKVLRFFALWDDRDALYGDRRPYVIHYFLADDTVEILEVNEPNSGRDPFPVFLKRGPLPDCPIEVDALGPTKKYTHYTVESFKVGSYVNVFGREMFIHDCDDFTRDYTTRVLGYSVDHMTKVNVKEPEEPLPQMELPPHNGFGSMLDSAQNCTQLIPKPPKRDIFKLMANDRKILRYTGKLVEVPGRPLTNADLDRKFIVQFFLSNDTVMIFEPPTRNSGIIGGKFLERMEVYKEGTNERYLQSDFFVGARMTIYCRCFELLEADDYTYTYMEDCCEYWPFSDYDGVVSRLRSTASGKVDDLRSAFIEVDASGSGCVDAPQLHAALLTAGCPVVAQEVITIVRKLTEDGDGSVSVEGFFASVLGESFGSEAK